MTQTDSIPESVRLLVDKLCRPRSMRRGSLGERLIKCGKARCAKNREFVPPG